MLNKIKIIGKFLVKKEQYENKIDDVDSVSQEMMSEANRMQSKFEATEENVREPWFRFSVMVWAPSGSKTTLRCIAQGEVAERIKRELIQEEVIEIRGYLRNEHLRNKKEGEVGGKYIEKKVGRQIIIKVVEFSKLDLDFEKIDQDSSNQVRLLGKIITDLQDPENNRNPEILSFKLAVPREGVKSPLFFCRVNEKELILEINKQLKKGDIILLEGFLQTQKIEKEMGGDKKEISWISSIICYGFTFLDSDSVNIFNPLDNLTRVVKEVSKIDFSKPKNKVTVDKQME